MKPCDRVKLNLGLQGRLFGPKVENGFIFVQLLSLYNYPIARGVQIIHEVTLR
jgi:hypothetical protein